jgi:hypothetical protein
MSGSSYEKKINTDTKYGTHLNLEVLFESFSCV